MLDMCVCVCVMYREKEKWALVVLLENLNALWAETCKPMELAKWR